MNKDKKIIIRISVLCVLAILIIAAIIGLSGSGSDNPKLQKSFLDQFVKSGGPIVWCILLPLSVVTVYLSVDYTLTIRRKDLLPNNISTIVSAMIAKNGLEGLKESLAAKSDLVSNSIHRAIHQSSGEHRKAYFRTLVAESLQEQALYLLRRIDWLNIIGNVAPMIGLFGTVFGMIKAFNGIVIAGGQPRPDQLASGISLALVTTFWGLLVAIPALAVHGIFRNRIETITSEAALESETALNIINAHLDQEASLSK